MDPCRPSRWIAEGISVVVLYKYTPIIISLIFMVFIEEISHEGLHQFRIVKGSTQDELNKKKKAIIAKWDEQWEKKCQREAKVRSEEESLAYAKELTEQAESIQESMDRILLDNIEPFSIDRLKSDSEFNESPPLSPNYQSMPTQPIRSDPKYNAQISGLAKLSKKKVEENERQNQSMYDSDFQKWKSECERLEAINVKEKKSYELSMSGWEQRRNDYYDELNKANDELVKHFEKFKTGDPESVEWFIGEAIDRISLPFEYR